MEFVNLANTIIKLGQENKEIELIEDQFNTPVYSQDLIEAIHKIIFNIEKYRGQILHLTNHNDEIINRIDVAKEIFSLQEKDIKIVPRPTRHFSQTVPRPKYTHLLNNSDIQLRDWKEALADYVKRISN